MTSLFSCGINMKPEYPGCECVQYWSGSLAALKDVAETKRKISEHLETSGMSTCVNWQKNIFHVFGGPGSVSGHDLYPLSATRGSWGVLALPLGISQVLGLYMQSEVWGEVKGAGREMAAFHAGISFYLIYLELCFSYICQNAVWGRI